MDARSPKPRGRPPEAKPEMRPEALFTLQQDPVYQLHFVSPDKPKAERQGPAASPSSLRFAGHPATPAKASSSTKSPKKLLEIPLLKSPPKEKRRKPVAPPVPDVPSSPKPGYASSPLRAKDPSAGLQFLRKSLEDEPPDVVEDVRAPDTAELPPPPVGDESTDEALIRSANLQTGEDAIAFFARHGSNSQIKFVHLNRATSTLFRPYDLVVVRPLDVQPEHFTMSASGLVHISPGCPSEFIALAEWMRQSTLFNVLTTFRFYKYYLVNKAFSAWFAKVRYKLFCRQRKALSSSLYLGKSSFSLPLLQVNKVMMDLQSVLLLDFRAQKTYEASAFVEYQATKRAEATKLFETCVEKLQVIAQKVCSDVNNLARQAHHNDDLNDLAASVHADKTKSIVAAKTEQQERRKLLKRAAEEAAMLCDFIRLIDYITTENLVLLAVQSCREFLAELSKSPRKTGLFETTIHFGDADTVFSPTCEQIQGIVVSMTDDIVAAVNSVSRIIYLRQFNQYIANAISDGPHVGPTITNSLDFQLIRAELVAKIQTDYLEAAEYVKIFDSVRPIYEYDKQWDFENDYSQRVHTVTSLKADMLQIATWEKELEKMRAGQTIGILHVESRKLKQNLIPMTAAKLDAMKGLVKDQARAKCKAQLSEYKQRIQMVSQRPQHLKEFAAHVERVQGLKSKQKALVKNTNVVDEMYRLLGNYGVRISSEDMVQLDDLRSVQESYKEETEAVEVYIQGKLGEMTQQLDANIARLDEQVIQQSEILQTGVFIDVGHFEDTNLVLGELDIVKQRLAQLEEMSKQYTEYQGLFNIDPYNYTNLATALDYFNTVEVLWTSIEKWNDQQRAVLTNPFVEVNVEELAKDVAVAFKDAYAMHKKLSNDVTALLKDKTSEFKLKIPTILELGSPSMKDRHWEKIFKALNQPWYPGISFSLDNLMQYDIFEFKDLVSEVAATSSGEAQIEASLNKIKHGWEATEFVCIPHRDSKEMFILGGLEDILTLLEDNQVTLQTMMGSRYIMGVKDEVERWNKKLALLSETIDEWVTVQRNWMYLETIFCAEDIQKQLPIEAQKFQLVDKNWKAIMLRTHDDPACLRAVENGSEVLDQFKASNQLLEEIQKSLEDYLETKRMAFPRFYFLSNDELLEILSQTRDPRAVQPHLGKCFDAMKSVHFEEILGQATPSNRITAMVSGEGERVQFPNVVVATGPVETWLLEVEKAMRHSLYTEAFNAFGAYPEENAIDRKEWLFAFPSQVIIMIDQVFWTKNVSRAIAQIESGADSGAVETFLAFSLAQIDGMVVLVRSDLSKLQRILMGALITIDVHARDVVRSLIANKIASLTDFEWTRQLRYYWEMDVNNCVCRQTNTRFIYAYEYLGNTPRLVITPLTDICYMTLTGALHLRLGGAPAGPAGTGKTETTKDLAKALAVQCVVFNCSDGLDYKIMGRFFSGLAQAGAWACFDEFNRIDIEVLSVIAQQILCIQQAIICNADQFDFEGKLIRLNTGFGVFITMNPGYAGRTELPDNLKALFRPVAMMVPDYRLIAEIVLFSEGFANALPLSHKMTQLYSLSSEQLSKQDHYDFGMRAVKSVLVAAGQLKRKWPETHEDLLLIRAMRDSNVPKFLEADLPLFRGIISDLFPGVVVPFVDYGVLQKAIETQLEALNLQQVASFVIKAIQVHETQLVRHGMMLVGEAGSGKSTNAMILAKALSSLYEQGVVDRDGFYKNVTRLTLNPKSISAGQLYGEFNLLTSEWTDGLVPKLVRQAVAEAAESDARNWVIFDGPVDAVWIENMNTVLDDNKTLCLSNSERIKLPATLHMMFEVQDLRVASPATVSRCGMVYMEQVHVGLISLARTWKVNVLDTFAPADIAAILIELIELHVPAAIAFVRSKCREKIPSNNGNLMTSFLNLLASCLRAALTGAAAGTDVGSLARMYFIFSLAWSVGANIDDASRPRFHEFCLQQLAGLFEFVGPVDNVYNYAIDDVNANWVSWLHRTPHFKYDAGLSYFSMLVPTQDTTRFRYLLERLMANNHHVLYSGETGVGKSVVIQAFLDDMAKTDSFVAATMGYSAQTKPANLNEMLELKLEKKRKNLLGPPSGKKMLMFIDDLNMPALEVYGAQPPNELLRQVIDQGGYYDTDKMFFKNVMNVVFAAACAPPGGGRSEVTPRLIRHFHMVWIPNLSLDAMTQIFVSILSGFLELEVPALAHMARPIVSASVQLYQRVEAELLPTPSKSHYTFNLRDLSKVFQGVLMITKEHAGSIDALVQLWLHEEARVFRDRLIDAADRTWFNTACAALLETHLKLFWEPASFEGLLYGDFASREHKVYQAMDDMGKLNTLLLEYLEEYNITFPSQMYLVFFNDAIHHVSRICRILRQPRGNALLVGVGGSGRQSLTRLAAFMADYRCFSIEITRGYGPNEFHEDLKKILMVAGAEAKPVVFLFSDTQIVVESFLEDINNVLNTGDVPNLYAADEMEKIVGMVRPLAAAAGKMTREDIVAHYIMLVRENLHMVLAFSPIGGGFRNRCRMFPSLVNCCTIDWFSAWPEDALNSVAIRFLAAAADELGIEKHVQSLCSMAVTIHRSVEVATAKYFKELKRQTYTTPTSYLELIRLYVDMLRTQRGLVKAKEARYRGGLKKLAETEDIVGNLKVELTELQPVLVKSQKETSELLIQVSKDQEEADKQQVLIEADVRAANLIADEVKIIKDDCQKDLDEAMPAYYAAIGALNSLKKDDITVLKTFTNPPKMVGVTLNAVCLLFGAKQEWNEAKKLLNDMKFLDKLKEYDKDNIPTKTIRQLAKFIQDDEFTPENLSSISSAATSLCMWVRAMYTYDTVAKNIGPKKEKLKAAEASLGEEQAKLQVKQAGLNEVLAKVAALKRTLQGAQKKKSDLEAQTSLTQAQLVRAEKLIDSLGEEKGRWSDCAESLKVDMVNLVGNMILSSGCIAYLGPFTAEFRHELQHMWVQCCKELHLPVDSSFSLERILSDPVVVREWNIMGLPADAFSTENGLFATMGRRWPLMIDPQGQANKWIKNMYKTANLQIIKLSEKDFLRTLENAIRYGMPVLLENVEEELDPSLEPVLLKQVFKRSGQNLLHLGDADIPYSDSFRFYITTKLANPHYMPEVCIKVTVINFTVTLTGLEDQLLVDVVRNERPDLEQKKDELTVAIASDKKALKEIEDKILYMLENSKGNILDDEELIDTLAHSKVTSSAIKTRMSEAEVTSKEINSTREGYRCVAVRGSIIYFVIANLALVDPMYQYSLQYYQKLFVMRLELSTKADVLAERLEILMNDVTMSMYVNVCRGLFEKDKVIFAFMIVASILRQRHAISAAEWNFYLIGAKRTHAVDNSNKPSWLPERVWIGLETLIEINPDAFTPVVPSLSAFTESWKESILFSELPHQEPIPGALNDTLTNFQKLLILRVFREEMLVFGTREFVGREAGAFFTESPPFDLKGCYNDSAPDIPLIFVLSPGADITDYLLELAKAEGKDGAGLKIISLGQGQGPIAEALMKQARETGEWVCLQNCHLAVSWLGKLEQILERSKELEIHSEFRLWLTSMPSPKFPVPILQNGIKITNEPPKGMRANLGRTFLDMKDADYEGCTKPREFKKFIFALAFYNALCLERRKFGAVGWNIPYEWMNSDLKTGMQQVKLYLEEQDEVPFVTLNVMVADITYGGRITDRWDKRTNSSIMRKLFHERLLDDDYKFASSATYYAPATGKLEDCRKYVASLPNVDAPDIFGLHANADITFQQKETSMLLGTMLCMLGGGGGGGGEATESDAVVMELVLAIQTRIPDAFDEAKAHPETFKETSGSRNSLGVFLGQELIRFNGLMKVMRSTLESLKRAIKGLVVMSGPLERMYNGFLVQKIPSEWEDAGYPCLKPLSSWTEDFFRRLEVLADWLVKGPPVSYWLPGFFFPQGFMTGVKQVFSREHKIAIDALIVTCEVLGYGPEGAKTPPPFGVYIYGLFMEGARFDRNTMQIGESKPGELFDKMPIIWLKPTRSVEYKPKDVYECPLYKTSTRAGTLSTTGHSTNFVVALDIPSKKSPDHWIRRGCAMLCMLDT
ncbi:dynein heavy chain [Achlya hypogyna]|uniref:Dynein heavy chain n=1 Tax=Achlya hypogyna TaxID=1202772 RepID=A0A1V9YL35_ACHHY|nr:dynein heavy chain [Achlya hypogyna]